MPNFLLRLIFVPLLVFAPCIFAAPQSSRGGRVSWARLITDSSKSWVHSEQEPKSRQFHW
jgi:hypothetical protein